MVYSDSVKKYRWLRWLRFTISYTSKNIPGKGGLKGWNGTKQGYRIWKFEPRLLPRHFLDIQIVLTVGDLYLFFDEAFVDLAIEGVDHTPPLYRMVDPA